MPADPKETARIDQETGVARALAARVSAFFLECLRSGVPQTDAVSLAGQYITADVNARLLKDHMDGREGKPRA